MKVLIFPYILFFKNYRKRIFEFYFILYYYMKYFEWQVYSVLMILFQADSSLELTIKVFITDKKVMCRTNLLYDFDYYCKFYKYYISMKLYRNSVDYQKIKLNIEYKNNALNLNYLYNKNIIPCFCNIGNNIKYFYLPQKFFSLYMTSNSSSFFECHSKGLFKAFKLYGYCNYSNEILAINDKRILPKFSSYLQYIHRNIFQRGNRFYFNYTYLKFNLVCFCEAFSDKFSKRERVFFLLPKKDHLSLTIQSYSDNNFIKYICLLDPYFDDIKVSYQFTCKKTFENKSILIERYYNSTEFPNFIADGNMLSINLPLQNNLIKCQCSALVHQTLKILISHLFIIEITEKYEKMELYPEYFSINEKLVYDHYIIQSKMDTFTFKFFLNTFILNVHLNPYYTYNFIDYHNGTYQFIFDNINDFFQIFILLKYNDTIYTLPILNFCQYKDILEIKLLPNPISIREPSKCIINALPVLYQFYWICKCNDTTFSPKYSRTQIFRYPLNLTLVPFARGISFPTPESIYPSVYPKNLSIACACLVYSHVHNFDFHWAKLIHLDDSKRNKFVIPASTFNTNNTYMIPMLIIMMLWAIIVVISLLFGSLTQNYYAQLQAFVCYITNTFYMHKYIRRKDVKYIKYFFFDLMEEETQQKILLFRKYLIYYSLLRQIAFTLSGKTSLFDRRYMSTRQIVKLYMKSMSVPIPSENNIDECIKQMRQQKTYVKTIEQNDQVMRNLQKKINLHDAIIQKHRNVTHPRRRSSYMASIDIADREMISRSAERIDVEKRKRTKTAFQDQFDGENDELKHALSKHKQRKMQQFRPSIRKSDLSKSDQSIKNQKPYNLTLIKPIFTKKETTELLDHCLTIDVNSSLKDEAPTKLEPDIISKDRGTVPTPAEFGAKSPQKPSVSIQLVPILAEISANTPQQPQTSIQLDPNAKQLLKRQFSIQQERDDNIQRLQISAQRERDAFILTKVFTSAENLVEPMTPAFLRKTTSGIALEMQDDVSIKSEMIDEKFSLGNFVQAKINTHLDLIRFPAPLSTAQKLRFDYFIEKTTPRQLKAFNKDDSDVLTYSDLF